MLNFRSVVKHIFPAVCMGVWLFQATTLVAQDPPSQQPEQEAEGGDENDSSGLADEIVQFVTMDPVQRIEARQLLSETSPLRQASMLQPTPFVLPKVSITEAPAPAPTATNLASLLQSDGIDRSVLRQAKRGVSSLSVDLVSGEEAAPLVTTDVGSLLKKSSKALSVEAQRRTPVVNDPRIRSSRIGSLAASGSYWVPAREDLDTIVSKIDSRLINDVIIIPGPYSSVYGPGFSFLDFEVLQSPRYADGYQLQGRSSVDHQSNGSQWLGLQSISGGSSDWGYRASYAHRLGGDYRSGNGVRVPSSYESREVTIALGRDFENDTSLELSLLRLDQTNVEFPGYVFDIDFLVSDGYEIAYIDSSPTIADRVETEIWYNRTRFEGNAQNAGKRAQFPLLNRVNYVGLTDVDSMSTGYRRARTWAKSTDDWRLTLGHDLRFIKQELNEIASGTTLGLPIPFNNRNSPIPRSFSVNPGLFAEYLETFLDDWTFQAGGRVDYVQTDMVTDQAELQNLGLGTLPSSYQEIIGTDITQTDRAMFSLYGTLTHQHNDSFITSASLGYAQRAPNLTALYAAQPFLLLIQNGLNNVTGDPTLKREQHLQMDLSADFDGEYLRFGVRGFHAWAFDYITFENTQVVTNGGQVEQVGLRYVNTSLATFTGFESFLELMPQRRLSPFASMRYVDGRDRTRNGDFATRNGQTGVPSARFPGLPRGFFSGVGGSDSEPLPGISPLETRIGFRLADSVRSPTWYVELAARIVDNQDRVATSLLETTTPGFTVLDLRGTYRPPNWENLVLVSGIENLTDKSYREHLDFRSLTGAQVLQPGVNFYFGSDLTY